MPERRSFAVAQTVAAMSSGHGRRIRARVWYPASAPGRDQPFDARAAPAPAVAFGHGHLATAGAYASLLARVASCGIVVIAPESERRLFPDHGAFARDLATSLDWLVCGAAGTAVPDGAVDPDRLGVAGHSMGGGCAVLAAAADPRLRTVATAAAARTRPSALEAAGELEVPILLVAAARDRVAPLGMHQRPIFEAVREGTPAQLVVLRDGVHAGFVDPLRVWWAQGPRPAAARGATQRALTAELFVSWLLLTLGGRDDLWAQVWGPAASARRGVALESRSAPRAPPAPEPPDSPASLGTPW